VALLAIAFVALTLGGSAIYWDAMLDKQQSVRETAQQRNAWRAVQLNAAVTQQLDATLRSVDIALKHLRAVYLQNPADFDGSAQDVMAAYPPGMIEFVTLCDAKGHWQTVPASQAPATLCTDSEQFRVHNGGADALFISAPVMNRQGGDLQVQFTRSIRQRGQLQGVIGIPLRPEYLSRHLLSLRVDPADILAVVRADGSIIARSHNLAEALQSRLPPDRPFLQAQAGVSGMFRSNSTFDRVPVLFSWQRLMDWPLVTVAAVNESIELEPLNRAMADERLHTWQTIALLIVTATGLSLLVLRAQQQKRALRLSEARHRALFDRSKIPILMIEQRDGGIVDANQAALGYYGYGLERMRQMHIADFNQLSPTEIQAEMALAQQEQRSCFHFPHRLASGEVRQVEVHSGPIEVDGRALLYSFVHDITDRRLLEDQVRQLAFHDSLTGLPNRRLLLDRLHQTMASARRTGCHAALMFLDLDNFKPLNDLHGHDMGDLLLVEVAARLASCVREMDTVARFGGDEFVVMLSALPQGQGQSQQQALAVAEKIRRALAEPYVLRVHATPAAQTLTHHCTASIGMTLFCDATESAEALLNQADSAMYRAKASGRNQIRLHPPVWPAPSTGPSATP
jgi:diguanylate cyclase (GGDEF)-like protein/PAS domain S-box-containing protein